MALFESFDKKRIAFVGNSFTFLEGALTSTLLILWMTGILYLWQEPLVMMLRLPILHGEERAFGIREAALRRERFMKK